MTAATPPSPPPPPARSRPPGANPGPVPDHAFDDSAAGEEDPGAGIDAPPPAPPQKG